MNDGANQLQTTLFLFSRHRLKFKQKKTQWVSKAPNNQTGLMVKRPLGTHLMIYKYKITKFNIYLDIKITVFEYWNAAWRRFVFRRPSYLALIYRKHSGRTRTASPHHFYSNCSFNTHQDFLFCFYIMYINQCLFVSLKYCTIWGAKCRLSQCFASPSEQVMRAIKTKTIPTFWSLTDFDDFDVRNETIFRRWEWLQFSRRVS